MLVLRGTYVTEAQGADRLCGPGTLIVNPSGTTHRDRFRTQDGKFFTISLTESIARRMECAVPRSLVLREARTISTIQSAYLELLNGDEISDIVLEGLGLELVAGVARMRSMVDKKPPRWLRLAQEYIHDRFSSKIYVTEIAALVGVHPVHLARAFRQYFQCSPGDYLRSCRIAAARQLLISSFLPLAELAQEAGFSDQSQFSHAFKRATGQTPQGSANLSNRDALFSQACFRFTRLLDDDSPN